MLKRRPTSAGLGFRMPAEWEPHEATWLAWPHNRSDWPGKFAPIPWVYCEIVRHLAEAERVRILVNDREAEERARRTLRRAHVSLEAVEFFRVATNRSWTRDYCPLFVKNAEGAVAAVKWRFNAWAKYDDWELDDAAGELVARKFGSRVWRPVVGRRRVVLEGGAIEVNGRGTLLATEECLLDRVQARNPGLAREDLERLFAAYLGVRKVLWLGRGIAGDDTHGHIDDIARFVGPATVAAAVERDPADANYEPLHDNLRRLRAMTNEAGRRLRVIELPMPAPVFFGGQRLPASYLNFYVANGLVLVPTFNDPNDRLAMERLAELFPDRRVVGIYARDLVLGLGTLHCLTMQQPAAGVSFPARRAV